MSKYFERIKAYYEKGIYKIDHLNKLLNVNAITQEEYDMLIAGE